MDPNVVAVQIFNSEYQKLFTLYVREDRHKAFGQFVLDERYRREAAGEPEPPSSVIPGLSWGAIMGLDAIFARRPKKFSTEDIVKWLQGDLIPLTKGEVETGLEKFSQLYPPDVSEDA